MKQNEPYFFIQSGKCLFNPAYTYDNNGNRVQKSYRGEQTVYNYDYDNQLVEVVYPDGASTKYSYDSEGRRRSEDRGWKIEDGGETKDGILLRWQQRNHRAG